MASNNQPLSLKDIEKLRRNRKPDREMDVEGWTAPVALPGAADVEPDGWDAAPTRLPAAPRATRANGWNEAFNANPAEVATDVPEEKWDEWDRGIEHSTLLENNERNNEIKKRTLGGKRRFRSKKRNRKHRKSRKR